VRLRVASLKSWNQFKIGLICSVAVCALENPEILARTLPVWIHKNLKILPGNLNVSQILFIQVLIWSSRSNWRWLAPATIAVPSGSKIKIEYRSKVYCPAFRSTFRAFGLFLKLERSIWKSPYMIECFLQDINPFQLTQDLKSFWSKANFEFKKELREEDIQSMNGRISVFSAEAVRGVKRRNQN